MTFPRSLAIRRFALVAAAAAATLVAGAVTAQAPMAQAPASVAPNAAEAATIRKLLEQRFPGVSIGNVGKSPYFGLYEVMFDDQLVYTDVKVTYVIVGSVYDASTKRNLTEARLRELSRVAFESLPLELSFKKVKGSGQRKLVVFSDPDCPFCARLEKELKSIENVTIYTFLYPIDQLHPDAARKSRLIWCAPDRVKAWDEFFVSGALPANNGDCDNPVAATAELGRKLKVNATPTLIFADGSIVAGALPAQRLEAEIRQGEAEAARRAAAKK